MPFNDISYLELWLPFCSAERKHLCSFGRGHYEEQFYARVYELISFKRFIWSSGGPRVQWSSTFYAILKEGIMGNIHVKLYEI